MTFHPSPMHSSGIPWNISLTERINNDTLCFVTNFPRLQVRFYKTVSGKEPVRDWLLTLSDDDKKTIGEDIKTVQFGWPIGMPVCR